MRHQHCWIDRVAVSVLLAGIAVTSGLAAFVLIDSRVRTGAFAGGTATTNQLARQGVAWFNAEFGLHGGVVAAALTLLMLAALGLLSIELRRLTVTPRLVLSRGGLGEVAIHLDQISKLAQHEAEHVLGVREVETSAHSDKAGIAVKQRVAVEPEVAFAPLAEQVQQRVKQSLEYHLGFPVAGVQILLQHAPISKTVF
jgi:uncharacterized alkaline shock family protein YloU